MSKPLNAEIVSEALTKINHGDIFQVDTKTLTALRERYTMVAEGGLWIPEFSLARNHANEMVRKIDDMLDIRKRKDRWL
jgi:hypothetical protein